MGQQKDTYYFQHDYEPTSDPKIQALLNEYDWLGYGLYWRIVEMLHSDPLHKLPKKKFIFMSLTSKSTSIEKVSMLVESCINDFELFVSNNDYFWSNRVLRNIAERDEKREKKVNSGRNGGLKSGENRRRNAKAPLKQNEAPLEASLKETQANEAKERKGKEIINNSPAELFSLDSVFNDAKDWFITIASARVEDFKKTLTIDCKEVYEVYKKDCHEVFPQLVFEFKKSSIGEPYESIEKFQRHFKSYCLKMFPIEQSKKRKAAEKEELKKAERSIEEKSKIPEVDPREGFYGTYAERPEIPGLIKK